MRPLVHVQSAHPDTPAKAAHRSCGWIFDALATRRGMTMLVESWRPLPGATVTPWVLRGVVAATPTRMGARRVHCLGSSRVAQQLFDAAAMPVHAASALAELQRAPRLRLRVPGSHRDAAVPRQWVGTNFVHLSPLSHRAGKGQVRGGSPMSGPASAALISLARACRLEGNPTQLCRHGATLAREVFASATLVLDATWWAPVDAQGSPVGSALAVEHCLATPSIGQVGAAAVLDAWICQLLGHAPRGDQSALTPRIAGQRGAWPRAPLAQTLGHSVPKARALATRAVEAIWSRSGGASGFGAGSILSRRKTPTARAALAPPTPGRFARAWAKEMR